MQLSAPIQGIDRAVSRLRDALTDPARRERNLLLTLAVYVAVWTAYGTITKGANPLHPDMTELLGWSQHLSLGYKHPPFAAWVVRLWFTFIPFYDWTYYLLAMLMPAISLWVAWRLSADYLTIEKRVFGVALLTLVPFFNFHALKYNVNTVLMPLWAATTLWFLRSYRTRSALYAAFAGLGAACAMMGKYWSIFLLAGLAVAALADSRRAIYFRSAAPWITVAVGLLAIAPHVVWLVQHDFSSFTYAIEGHADRPIAQTAADTIGYLTGSLAYVAVPVVVVLVVSRLDRATLADMIWPAETERRLAAAAFWAPLLLPAVIGVPTGTDINPLWTMSAWTLLPVLLLSPPAMTISAVDTRRLLVFAVGFPFVMLIASPFILDYLRQH